MISNVIKEKISNGALTQYAALYPDIEAQKVRFISAIESFEKIYGEGRDVSIFSVPGRSEISGNHTDHNGGKVVSCAISLDTLATFLPTDNGIINIKSE